MNTLPKLRETFHDRTDASPPAARFLVSNPATVQNVSLLPHSFTLIRGNCILSNSAVAVVLLTGLACPPDHAFVQCVGTGHGRQWQLSCPPIPFPFRSFAVSPQDGSVSSDCVGSPRYLLAALGVAFASRCR